MSTSFQPQDPHPDARSTRRKGSIIATAIVAALMVVMIGALLFPRFVEGSEPNWILTIGAGILTMVAILAYGFMRRG